MARSSERLSADAYTRSSVEDYLQAAAEQRARIELAIAEAGRRRERAIEAKEWLDKHQESSPAPSDPHAAPEAGVGEGDGA